jgi:hypothetical protein
VKVAPTAHQRVSGVVEQRKSADDVRMARWGAVFAHDRVALPVIADFGSLPVAAHDGQPLVGCTVGGQQAGDEVAFQSRFFAAGLVEEPSGDGQERPAAGHAGFAGVESLDTDAALLKASADNFGEGKKGARSRRDCASLYKAGWLPLTCKTYSPFCSNACRR